MNRRIAWLLLALFAGLGSSAAAQDVVIYRCTDAQGALSIQNMPCPKGSQQQKKTIPALQPAPPPRLPQLMAAPAVVAPAPPTPPAVATVATAPAPMVSDPPPAAAEQAPRPPPPPLFQCVRRDDTRYLSEDTAAATYCVPMRVTGLDGNPMTGAGEACEVVHDRCDAVPPAEACAAWSQRLKNAESHWRFATPAHAEQLRQDYDRIRTLLQASDCPAG